MLPRTASEQYRQQQAIAATTAAAVRRIWARMGTEFDASWEQISGQVLAAVQTGRASAVRVALPYTGAVLAETGDAAPGVGSVVGAAFLTSAPDGRGLDTLYGEAVVNAKTAVKGGLAPEAALSQAGRWMTMATLTVMADTRRMVYQADMIQRPTLQGYVRMLNGPSCSRCIILAGRFYRWNEGFQRHPRCDCTHIAASENVAGDLRTDPYATFESMSQAEQESVFGRSEARAIREGADIYKVTNQSVRKLATANSRIDQIYRTAGTRTNAVRMLREQGFIRERGQVTIPLAPGVRTDAQILAAGRGRGSVLINGQRVTTARAARFDAAQTGARNPLQRSTMTAAERRLYDASYRLNYATRTGTVPRSIGPNTADRGTRPIPATPERLAELRRDLQREIRVLDQVGTPQSVRNLARTLGLI